MPRWVYKLRNVPLHGFVWLIIGLARILPAAWAYKMGKGLAQFAWTVLPSWRRNAYRNFELFFKDELPRSEYAKLGKLQATHLGWYVIEFIRMGFVPVEKGMEMITEVEGEEHYAEALANGKGVIALAMHYGNWDLCGGYITREFGQLHAVGKRQADPFFDNIAFPRRERYGMKNIFAGKRANSAILKTLKDNEILGLLCDQNGGTTGTFAPFAGIPASTVPGPAALALKTGAPLILTFTRRIEPGRFKLIVKPPIDMDGLPEDRNAAKVEVLTRVNQLYFDTISEDPSQWLWGHKRWRTRPNGEKPLY